MSRVRSGQFRSAAQVALVLAAAVVVASANEACGGGSGGSGTHSTGTATSMSNGSHMGGGSASSLADATPIVTDAVYALALDATLSNDGSIAYFTGIGPNGPGVFSVPSGGGAPAKVADGTPFAAPFGIALSTDGKTLYVADTGAEGPPLDAGRILSVSAEGGMPKAIMGTDDALPRGLEVVDEGGKDSIYFAGTVGGAPGLFKVPAAGGAVTALAKGAPFTDPSGVTVTKDGKQAYVLDTTGSGSRLANIIGFDGAKATQFVADLVVGYPAGIALSHDEKALLVSSYDKDKGVSRVQIIDILSKESTYFPTDGLPGKSPEPGGLHRARNANQFAWVNADPKGGSVLLLK